MHYWFTADELELIRLSHEQALHGQQHVKRRKQHHALFNDRNNYDYFGRVRAFAIERTVSQDPETTSEFDGGPQTCTLHWRPFYVEEKLDPNDNDVSKWGNGNEA